MFKFRYKFLLIVLFSIVIFSLLYNKFVLPVVIEITEKYAVTAVNKEINSCYSTIIKEKGLSQTDFALYSNENNFMNTNTVNVNILCNEMAEALSQRLNSIEDKKIKLPVGIFSTMTFLSHSGPEINMSIDSMGEAKVDYESSFTACGVNQVNYRLWLNIETEVSVINPFVHKNIVVNRKLAVIDIVYNGGVPNTYVNVDKNK